MTAGLRLRPLWLGVGIALLGLLAGASLIPEQLDQPGYPQLDKVLHASAYAVVTGWFLQLVRGYRATLAVVLGMVAYGLALEGIQSLIPPREPSLLDALANTAGILLATALCTICRDLLRQCERRVLDAVR